MYDYLSYDHAGIYECDSFAWTTSAQLERDRLSPTKVVRFVLHLTAAVMLLLLAICRLAPAANIVLNTGFETGDPSSWTLPIR
jgi:hypothetical protein